MGICGSTVSNQPTHPTDLDPFHARIKQALLIKRDELTRAGVKVSFEKVLLRFDRMRKVLRRVKAVYNEVAEDKGGLNFEGLHKAMLKLHDNISRNEVVELFQFVDLDSSKVIELKEFLVALTVGYVIESIPTFKTLRRASNAGSDGHAHVHVAVSRGTMASSANMTDLVRTEADELKNMLNLIVTAYLLFDPEGEGHIKKDSLEKLVEEGGEKARKNMNLTEQLWQEMDWDANGMIDFAEFVHTFSDWVDLDEEAMEETAV